MADRDSVSEPSGSDSQRLTATVIGRVQGVGFRWWVRSAADRLGLRGWVMNDPNERAVEVLAEGPSPALDELERLLREGPPGAVVETVHARRSPASGSYGGFQITRPGAL